MSDGEPNVSRRDFLKIAIASAAGLALGPTVNPEKVHSGMHLEMSEKPGILDVLWGGRIVNNLVLLVTWDGKYNNSEMQGIPIEKFPGGLRYRFNRDETAPVFNPASGITIEMGMESTGAREVILSPKIVSNPNGLTGIGIGLGCFWGVNHGVVDMEILYPWNKKPYSPGEISGVTKEGQLGEFKRFDGGFGFRLPSVYPDMPSLVLSGSGKGWVDAEARNGVWDPSQAGLWERLRETSGRDTWIEAAIAYSLDPNPEFRLEMQPAKGFKKL